MKSRKDLILNLPICAGSFLVLLLLAQVLFRPFPQLTSLATGEPSENNVCAQVKLGTVKVWLSKNTWGSGTLIRHELDQYTLITNGHVLHGNKEQYTIETSDHKLHQAFVLARFDQHKDFGTDLAILRFSSPNNYKTFNLSKWIDGERVIGAGFPVNLAASSSQGLICTEFGKAYSLDQPMKKGYQLGFFLSIPSGMSGGPLLNEQGEVVGINGMGDPLLFVNSGIYQFRNSAKVSEEMAKRWNLSPSEALKRLSRSSWAIPSDTIVSLLPGSLNLALSPSSNKSPNAEISNPPDQTVAISTPIPTATKPNLTLQDVAKKLVSVGLVTKSNGQIMVDPFAVGVIVGKKNTTYYVLTTEKSVSNDRRYGIMTSDRKSHLAKVNWKKVDLDLVLLEFDSNMSYEVTLAANIKNINSPLSVYAYGWQLSIGTGTPILVEGFLNNFESLKLNKDFIYDNRSSDNLNGGIILNANGELIGLHKEFSLDLKTGKGIPIYKFLLSLPNTLPQIVPPKTVAPSSCGNALFGNCSP